VSYAPSGAEGTGLCPVPVFYFIVRLLERACDSSMGGSSDDAMVTCIQLFFIVHHQLACGLSRRP
jgi:hypothetical protein